MINRPKTRRKPNKLPDPPKHLLRYIDYLNNTGKIQVKDFDDDWEPIGPMLREELLSLGLVYIIDDKDMGPPMGNLTWVKPQSTGIFLRPDLIKDNELWKT
jgi:hypothetical protein